MTVQQRVFSAPGKALLAGGYLVLDPAYKAFVVALSSRMHAVTNVQPSTQSTTKITVKSPQFFQGEWCYDVDLSDFKYGRLKELSNRKNPFVESTISIVLTYLNPTTNLDITIINFSDSGYHSQVNSTSKSSTNKEKTFSYHELPITQVSKTGLGSSAALVTSLTTALLSCFIENFQLDDHMLSKIHNLSQVAHCLAQGKVGSGFDVASATFGSIVYQRFDATLINQLTTKSIDSLELQKLVDSTDWKSRHDKCGLPEGIKLLMGDIVGGSETPKLVTKVSSWRKENPEDALQLYKNLNDSNMSLVKSLKVLQNLSIDDPISYDKLLAYLNAHTSKEIVNNAEQKPLINLIQSVSTIRKYLKEFTVKTGAEIEPDEQTKLLNKVNDLKGCLGGVVPGAGGYDAICILIAQDSIPNLPKVDGVSWLDLEEQDEGLIEENVEDFDGLL